jgi:hypothetical protein
MIDKNGNRAKEDDGKIEGEAISDHTDKVSLRRGSGK